MQRVRFLFTSALLVMLASPALVLARDLELTAFGGYNLGGSIDVRENQANTFYTQDSPSVGAALTWQRSDSHAFELYWAYRPTHIEARDAAISGSEREEIMDLKVHDFLANFLFMPAYREGNVTPFLLLGLGVTYFDPGDVETVTGTISPDGMSKFSWGIGAGFKAQGEGRLGLRAQARYHSTYVNDESDGTWCDPWYGCYETVDTNWLDEWEFQGGLILKLGEE